MSKYDEQTELADARAHETEHLDDMANQTWKLRARRAEQRIPEVERERDEARARIEELGEIANVCVGRYLGRRCSYCQCDGKNLSDQEVQGKVKLGSNSEMGGE